MTEKEFQSTVIELAHLRGWRVAHFRPAMTAKGAWVTPVAADGKGFPDLCMVRRGRLVFAELKIGSRVSVEQRDWLDALSGAGIETHVWKPKDWDTIEEVLK